MLFRGHAAEAKSDREVEAHKMKKLYEIPELKVALLERTDVIVTSGEDDEDNSPLAASAEDGKGYRRPVERGGAVP